MYMWMCRGERKMMVHHLRFDGVGRGRDTMEEVHGMEERKVAQVMLKTIICTQRPLLCHHIPPPHLPPPSPLLLYPFPLLPHPFPLLSIYPFPLLPSPLPLLSTLFPLLLSPFSLLPSFSPLLPSPFPLLTSSFPLLPSPSFAFLYINP